MASLTKELDKLFGKIYEYNFRNDYFNNKGKGKFQRFVEGNFGELDDEIMKQLIVLKSDVNPFVNDINNPLLDDFAYIPFGDHNDRKKAQKQQFISVLQQLYQQRVVPSNITLRSELELRVIQSISWKHIANSLKHQMYSGISDQMQAATANSKYSFDISERATNKFIDSLQKHKNLSQKEVNFIRRAVGRARILKTEKYVPEIS